jgi:hypothetical protein
MDKRTRTASELEAEVRGRLGPGDYLLTIHKSPVNGWHAMVQGNPLADVDHFQTMADKVVVELSQCSRPSSS